MVMRNQSYDNMVFLKGGRMEILKGFRLIRDDSLVQFSCDLCTKKNDSCVYCEASDGMRICHSCIQTRDFDRKLLAHAQYLEGEARARNDMAQDLKCLIGRLDVPFYDGQIGNKTT